MEHKRNMFYKYFNGVGLSDIKGLICSARGFTLGKNYLLGGKIRLFSKQNIIFSSSSQTNANTTSIVNDHLVPFYRIFNRSIKNFSILFGYSL